MTTQAPSDHAAPSRSPAWREIDPREAASLLERRLATLIDVREPDEHARERIAGASLAPLARLDPAALAIRRDAPDHAVIVHCKSGVRSAEAATRLAGAVPADLFSIRGGIDAWKRAGLPTVIGRGPRISIMRQVQIVVGAATLAGAALALALSPWFIIVPAFFGAGLLFAGVSGFCGLGALLALAPWNRLGNG